MIEGAARIRYTGWFTKDALPAGTEILLEGYRAKDGSNRAVGKNITLPDGKRLFLGGSAPGRMETKVKK